MSRPADSVPREPGQSWAVLDLGFGDAGKGLVTDALVRRTGARVVVRAQGGAQAGHNVVGPGGRHHTFAQLGATFVEGVRVLLGPEMIVHPTALLVEARALGVDPFDRVRIAGDALVITPYHQAANRIRERRRGAARNGSCGVGVGETVLDARLMPAGKPNDAIRARELGNEEVLRDKLARVRARKLGELALNSGDEGDEGEILRRDDVMDRWIAAVRTTANLVTDDPAGWVDGRAAIFEGAQGVLLDEHAGFAPHVTRADTTFAPAERLAASLGITLRRLAVLRAHAVRHGAGPLPTADPRIRPRSDHNAQNEWQGPVRYGVFDVVLARYALSVTGPVDGLVLTHMDGPADALATRWAGDPVVCLASATAARPSVVRTTDLPREVANLLQVRVLATSTGPRATDLAWAT